MSDWEKYKVTSARAWKPPTIMFRENSKTGIVAFSTTSAVFALLGLDPKESHRADLYFKDDVAAIVPHPNGTVVWRRCATGGAAFKKAGWTVTKGSRYSCKKGTIKYKHKDGTIEEMDAAVVRQDSKQ